MSNRVMVVGTGTGVGKTHASITLLTALCGQGRRVVGLKPIETGVGLGITDAAMLARASSFEPQPAPYTFPDPISPHLAARRAGIAISLEVIAAWVERHQADCLIVESAGGLLSPLGVGLTNLDMVRVLAPQTLFLVASDRLGVLHDVHACMLALKTLLPSFTEVICLLQAPAVADSSTGTNASELTTLGTVSALTSFPRAHPEAEESVAAAAEALRFTPIS